MKNKNLDDKNNGIRLSKNQLNTLSNYPSEEFIKKICEPIKSFIVKETGNDPYSQLTYGQTAIMYFEFLDTCVTKYGFADFYWEYYWSNLESNLKETKKSLQYFGCTKLLEIFIESEKIFEEYESIYDANKWFDNYIAVYENTPKFDDLDDEYESNCGIAYEKIKEFVISNVDLFFR